MGNWILFIVLVGSGSGSKNPQMEHMRFYNEAACKATAERMQEGVKKVNEDIGYYFACFKDN